MKRIKQAGVAAILLGAVVANGVAAATPSADQLVCELKESIVVVKDTAANLVITEISNVGEAFQQNTEVVKKNGVTLIDNELVVLAKTKNKVSDLVFKYIEDGTQKVMKFKVDFANKIFQKDDVHVSCD